MFDGPFLCCFLRHVPLLSFFFCLACYKDSVRVGLAQSYSLFFESVIHNMTTMLPLDGGNFQSIIASYGSTAVAAIFISLALAFLRLRSSRAPLQMATNVAVEDDSPPKVRHIPGPGEVKVSKILIHPIKVCFFFIRGAFF